MKTSFTLCMLFLVSATAAAQDFSLPTKMEFEPQAGVQKAKRGDTEWSSEILIQYCSIGGDTGATDLKTWDKIFSDGFGFRFEGDYEYHFDQTWSIGGYLSTGFDFFGGQSATDPTTGLKITFDDWLVIPFTVGPKGKVYFGAGFFAELYLGFGFADYSAVDASAAGTSVAFLDGSIAFAWEIGGHIGYKFTQKFGILFGFGYQSWGAPKYNQTTFGGSGISAKSVDIVTIDIGVWFRF